MNVRTVFMGSPDFALPTLARLNELVNIVGVITQPDRPAGRGRVMTPPPIKVLAEQLGLPVIQPEKMRLPEAQAALQEWSPDLIVVAAFGQILRQNVLDLPRFGCLNVHASYLPRWRGAAPIQAAILAGDEFTGVSIMRMDAGIDTGPVLAQRKIAILPEDTAGTLSDRLAQAGADLLAETLGAYLENRITAQPQDERLATYARMLKKEDGLLDFSQPAAYLERQVRAFQPWPGAYFMWSNAPLKVGKARVDNSRTLQKGQRGAVAGYPAVGCAEGVLVLEEVQPAGKKMMSGDVFLRGAAHWLDE